MPPFYKRILLVNPGYNTIFGTNEPLNLALLAGFLRIKGLDVLIADKLSGEGVIKKYNYFKPDIIGITATTPVIKDAYDIAAYFREKGIPTVLGGVHVTTFPHEALNKADMTVKGEGEYPLLTIIMEGKDRGVFSSDTTVDINEMPLPARDLLNNEYYIKARRRFPQDGWFIDFPWNSRILSVLISRGCYWDCAFCHNTWRGTPFRIYNPEKVIQELIGLKVNYGLDYFIFRDDNIFSNQIKIKEILQAMIDNELNLKWIANARVDNIDEEILGLSKRAGCIKLNFGFESGSQRILDDLNKKTNVEKYVSTVELCKKHKIRVSGSFIVGHPNEEISDMNATRSMIRKLSLDSIGIAIATVFPATRWWEIAKERDLIPNEIEWEKFDFDHVNIKINENFSASELKAMQRSCFISAFKANPKYMVKIIQSFILNPRTLRKRINNVLGFS